MLIGMNGAKLDESDAHLSAHVHIVPIDRGCLLLTLRHHMMMGPCSLQEMRAALSLKRSE